MQNLFHEIARLSKEDLKTLSQKITKTVTEVGELASVGLALESAHGVTPSIASREMVLEECCDVMLCAASIPLSMGFSMVEIEEMLHAKVAKWSMKNARVGGTHYPIPYELHVSVDIRDVDSAKSVCESLGIKLTILTLVPYGETFDAMTSVVHYGDNSSALAELEKTAKALRSCGVTVVREKIETVPWHPLAPNGAPMPTNCYYEAHVAVELLGDYSRAYGERKTTLEKIAGEHGAKISYNVGKTFTPEHQLVMVTLRSYVLGLQQFEESLSVLVKSLTENGFSSSKPNIEFAMYDTNPQHDYKW